MKYVLYIDNKDGKTYSYGDMNATTLEDAIAEADEVMNDGIYLMRIMKKSGAIEKYNDINIQTYVAILCRRSNGWHRNTVDNGEGYHAVKRCRAKYGFWFETC